MLDKSFSEILETLSKTVHNQWMDGRLSDGWKYGTKRDDEKKEHSHHHIGHGNKKTFFMFLCSAVGGSNSHASFPIVYWHFASPVNSR